MVADTFELSTASIDGIFFDPYLAANTRNDPAFWNAVVPPMVALLRPGGVFVPCLRPSLTPYSYISSSTPSYSAETTPPTTRTTYTAATSGHAFIQCFSRLADAVGAPGLSKKKHYPPSCGDDGHAAMALEAGNSPTMISCHYRNTLASPPLACPRRGFCFVA